MFQFDRRQLTGISHWTGILRLVSDCLLCYWWVMWNNLAIRTSNKYDVFNKMFHIKCKWFVYVVSFSHKDLNTFILLSNYPYIYPIYFFNVYAYHIYLWFPLLVANSLIMSCWYTADMFQWFPLSSRDLLLVLALVHQYSFPVDTLN